MRTAGADAAPRVNSVPTLCADGARLRPLPFPRHGAARTGPLGGGRTPLPGRSPRDVRCRARAASTQSARGAEACGGNSPGFRCLSTSDSDSGSGAFAVAAHNVSVADTSPLCADVLAEVRRPVRAGRGRPFPAGGAVPGSAARPHWGPWEDGFGRERAEGVGRDIPAVYCVVLSPSCECRDRSSVAFPGSPCARIRPGPENGARVRPRPGPRRPGTTVLAESAL